MMGVSCKNRTPCLTGVAPTPKFPSQGRLSFLTIHAACASLASPSTLCRASACWLAAGAAGVYRDGAPVRGVLRIGLDVQVVEQLRQHLWRWQ